MSKITPLIRKLNMVDIIKILVIEREAVISNQLKQRLNKDIVFRVTSLPLAIECLKSIFFDMVIVDVHQDWNDQKDYQLLRSMAWMSPQIKIVLLIPLGKQARSTDLEGLKIDDFILKPCKNNDLISSINYLRKSTLACLF